MNTGIGSGDHTPAALVVVGAVALVSALALPATRQLTRRTFVRNRLVAVSSGAHGRSAATCWSSASRRWPLGRGMRWAPRWFVRRTGAMAVASDPTWLFPRIGLLAAATIMIAGLAGGPALAAVTLLAGAFAAAMVVDLYDDRADRLVDAGLPLLLDRVASGLRAGLSLPVALSRSVPTEPGPLRDDIAAVAVALDAGVPLSACLARWRARRPTTGTCLTTAALTLCWLLGGRSRPLDGVASTLRDRQAIDREVRAVSAQARASVLVLVATPWVFVALTAAQDPDVLTFFVERRLGMACLATGLALDGAGAWLMARIIKAAV